MHMSVHLIVTIIRGYYILRFFAIRKIAKLSTRKNFYQHIWHSGVYNHKLRDVCRRIAGGVSGMPGNPCACTFFFHDVSVTSDYVVFPGFV